jgi:UPF0271 protein
MPDNLPTIDINCDMGEGMPGDALIMPYISSANIACCAHAGDEATMQRTAASAIEHGVAIGAHPGFADKENFGRTEMHLPSTAIYDLVTQQVFALQKIVNAMGASLQHVKPHGALYNMSARDPQLAATIAQAVYDVDSKLVLFGLSGSCSLQEAAKTGLATAAEVFADRTYQDDGSLTPRSQPNAMITDTKASMQQVLQMIRHATVTSITNKTIPISAQTICIHGDGAHALDFAKTLYHTLQNESIGIGKK